MGKGGSSSSNSTTSTKNTSGQNAIQGDNLGVALSGVSESEINIAMSDHGAIEAAKELGELAIGSSKAVSSEAMQYVAGLAGNQAKQNSENLKTMTELAQNSADGGASDTNSKMLRAIMVVVGGAVVVMTAKAVTS